MTRRLLVCVTGHGFGHAAQTAPIIDALEALCPDLELAVRCELPADTVRRFFPRVAGVTRPTADFGLAMRSAIDVDDAGAERAFTALHDDLDATVAREAAALAALGPDLVLANVGYVPLAAAARAGIPAIGFSSLNWLGIARGYAGRWAARDRILAEMATAYRTARLFIRPTPAMPMPDLATVQVGPVARRGVQRRDRLAERLGLGAGERVVLVSLGGIETALDLSVWPVLPGIRYVVAGLVTPARPDMTGLPDLGLSHIDCLASCDAVLTKPGYGTVAETACHGTPVLFVRRGTWPEEPHLVSWLEARANAREIDRATLEAGTLRADLDALWAQPRRPAARPTGNVEAARLVAGLLRSA